MSSVRSGSRRSGSSPQDRESVRPMLAKSELDPETLAYIDLAKSSRTYDEYVFKCEISQMPPKSECEYGVNRLGRILTLDARSGYLLLQEVKD